MELYIYIYKEWVYTAGSVVYLRFQQQWPCHQKLPNTYNAARRPRVFAAYCTSSLRVVHYDIHRTRYVCGIFQLFYFQRNNPYEYVYARWNGTFEKSITIGMHQWQTIARLKIYCHREIEWRVLTTCIRRARAILTDGRVRHIRAEKSQRKISEIMLFSD